jgi:succinate dehydrogenase / fumarate reductase flavoprotein subunit
LHTLFDQLRGYDNVDILNDRMLLNVDTQGKRARGISALNIPAGTIEMIQASAVIVATGGYGGVYFGQTTNSTMTTGEGIAASARGGAYLRDMEFVQFHPTTLEGTSHLISEAARAEGGILVDHLGARFVDELATRDHVARAIGEVYESGGKVFLDLRHLGEEKIDALLPQERMLCKKYLNLDPVNDLIPIKPSAHYTMGGVAINERCETKVKGLYACGEASCSGVHGANRLGGNSLLEIVIFGHIAGEEAASFALSHPCDIQYDGMQFWKDETAFVVGAMNLPCQIDFYEKRSMLGKIMNVNVGLFKEERYLKAVMGFIRQAQDEYPFMGVKDKSREMNTNLVEFIEFGNMLQLAEMIVVASLNRMESRGSHFRRDFPARNDEVFGQHSLVWLTDGVVHMEFEETLAKLR